MYIKNINLLYYEKLSIYIKISLIEPVILFSL